MCNSKPTLVHNKQVMRTNMVVSFVELRGLLYELQAFLFCYCGEYPTLPVVKEKEGNPGPIPVFKSMPTSDSKVLTHVTDPWLVLLGKHLMTVGRV